MDEIFSKFLIIFKFFCAISLLKFSIISSINWITEIFLKAVLSSSQLILESVRSWLIKCEAPSTASIKFSKSRVEIFSKNNNIGYKPTYNYYEKFSSNDEPDIKYGDTILFVIREDKVDALKNAFLRLKEIYK